MFLLFNLIEQTPAAIYERYPDAVREQECVLQMAAGDDFNSRDWAGLAADPVNRVQRSAAYAVSARQLRQAMNRTPHEGDTLRAAVEAAIALADQDTRDWWERSELYVQDHPTVIQIASQLGKTTEDIQALWALAYSL